MESSREKSGGVGDETYMPPSALGTGENPNMRICDLEPYIEQEQKQRGLVIGGASLEFIFHHYRSSRSIVNTTPKNWIDECLSSQSGPFLESNACSAVIQIVRRIARCRFPY